VAPSVVAADGDRYGLPNVILEAAAVGVPIVASNVSAIPEFVAHGETGVLVPPGDPRGLAAAIGSLLADPAHGEAMAQQARRRVLAEYDGYRNAEALEALFRKARTGRWRRGSVQPAEVDSFGRTTRRNSLPLRP
jgi:glycosyltransferase involved in cell wall biosynthesis